MKEPRPTTRLSDPTPTDAPQASELAPLILVVDDMLDNAVVISLALQQQGYRVVNASNGEEALKVAAISCPDLILMDLRMPQLDGLGATRRLREDTTLRTIPVIALTAFDTEGFLRAAYDAGIDGYLTKPINFDRLFDLIRSKLSDRQDTTTQSGDDHAARS